MYSRHHSRDDFATAICWGIGIALGFWIGGLIASAITLVGIAVWSATGALPPAGKVISRAILIALALSVLIFLLLVWGAE
jgi:hypothetical protein